MLKKIPLSDLSDKELVKACMNMQTKELVSYAPDIEDRLRTARYATASKKESKEYLSADSSAGKAKVLARVKEYKFLDLMSRNVLRVLFRNLSDDDLINWGKTNYIDEKDSPDRHVYNAELARRLRAIRKILENIPYERKVQTHEYDLEKRIQEIVVSQVNKYIRSFARERNGAWAKFEQNKEDIYQSYIFEVIRRFPDYDGSRALSTFLIRPILGANSKFIADANNINMYELEMSNRVRRVIKKLEADGISPEDILVDDIKQEEPEMSEKTIAHCLDIISKSTVEYSNDYMDETQKYEGEYANPLDTAIKSDSQRELANILERLAPHEKIALKLAYGVFDEETGDFNKELSNKWIGRHRGFINEMAQIDPNALESINPDEARADLIKRLKREDNPFTPEEAVMFSLHYEVKPKTVQRIITDAMNKVQRMPSVKEQRSRRTDRSYGAYVSVDALADSNNLMDMLEEMG